jgi:hypothetical protein
MKHRLFTGLLVALTAVGLWEVWRQEHAIGQARAALAARAGVVGSTLRSGQQSSAPPELPAPVPSKELLRLRGEVTVLRQELATVVPIDQGQTDSSDDRELVYGGPHPSDYPDFVRFGGLTNAGSATPEAAFQSFHVAMANQIKEPLTPTRMKELWDVPDDFDQPPGYNIDLGEGLYGGSGYRIISREEIATNGVRLTIDYEKEDGSSYRRERTLIEHRGRWRMQPAAVTR